MQKVFYGKQHSEYKIPDFGFREMIIMGSLTAVIIWLGLFPSSVLNVSEKPVKIIIQWVNNNSYKMAQKESKTEYKVTPEDLSRQLNKKTVNSRK
jgi:NADH-quinone oxidoreductase subunit M